MRIECKHCNTTVRAEDRGKYTVEGREHMYTIYWLLECPVCHKPIVVRQSGGMIVETSPGNMEEVLGPPVLLFPVSKFQVNPLIPEVLRSALKEAIQTHEAGIYTAAAIMCRRTLDGFCAENGATKKNLAANLRELRDDGAITDQLYEWADALRLSGNEAAHDVQVTFSAEDARDLLDFTVAILDFTYSFRVKFEAFRERRGG